MSHSCLTSKFVGMWDVATFRSCLGCSKGIMTSRDDVKSDIFISFYMAPSI